jgi:CRISPR/Cas system-associated exonuclease Cas4 (RecB family)
MPAWSYSSLKTFQQCPKKYYHLKVAKDVKDDGSEATIYGKELHKVAEDYVRDNVPIPERFKFIQKTVDALKNIPGEKHTEIELGVTNTGGKLSACGFYDKDAWYRGIADLLIINGDEGYLVDYKSSKNAKYADLKQLDLLAAAVFIHFPDIKSLKSALIFVVSNEFVNKEHSSQHKLAYFEHVRFDLERLEVAMKTGVWNAVSSPLCGWCPVKTCQNYRERRK